MKKFFEKHDLVKISLGMILLSLILTWIIPKADFSTGKLVMGDIARMGIFDFFTYGILCIYYFTVMATFIFVLGAFYQFLSKLGAYQKLTDKLGEKVKGKEILFSLIVSFIFAGLASIINEQLVLVAFMPFIITICNKGGMDKISSFVATFGAMLVGILGSTVSTKIVGMNVQYFSLQYTDRIWTKIIFFAVAFIIYSVFNVLYLMKASKKEVKIETTSDKVIEEKKVIVKKATAKKVTKKTTAKKSTSKKSAALAKTADIKEVVVDGVVEENTDLFANTVENSETANTIPLIIVGILFILVAILAYLPWTTVFNIDWFTNAYNWVTTTNFFGVPVLSYVFGTTLTEFGSWDLFAIQVVMILTMIVLQLCYRVSVDDFLESIGEGFKKVSKLVMILLLAYIILIFAVIFPIVPTIIGKILTKKFNVFTSVLGGLITGLFTSEYQYAVNLVYSNFSLLYPKNFNVISLILQSTFGLMSFVTPASVFLFVGLSYLNIPYKDWMKYIWKFLLVMLVAIVVMALIVA